MRIDEALREARARLAASPTPGLDAELLLGRVLGQSRTYLYTWPERRLEAPQQEAFAELVTRRAKGEPVAHLTGEREFYGRSFRVTPDTLIPRPDTESVVEAVLDTLPSRPLSGVDLGTGTGAIGITLALERPAWRWLLVDRSAAALAVARDNAARLGARVSVSRSSWLDAIPGRFDLIVSNPPYIDPMDPHLHRGDVRFEPPDALVAAEHGLAALRTIADQALDHLNPCGWLILEHGHDQGSAVTGLLEARGYKDIYSRQDLGGNDRVTMGHV